MDKRYDKYYLAAFVSVVTFAIYLPALRNGFVNWDDNLYVYENSHIRSLGLDFLRWAFTDSSANYWHPLTWISYAVDYSLWGLSPAGYHLTNIFLHAANTFLVVCLVALLLGVSNGVREPAGAPDRDKETAVLIAAGATGFLFGLHPLHVESVAWISERKDLLYSFFFLLSILSYARFASDPGNQVARTTWRSLIRNRHYLLAIVFFSLSLCSKPMAVILPAVFFLLDWHPFRRSFSPKNVMRLVREKMPFLAMSIFVSAVTFVMNRADVARGGSDPVSLPSRVLVAFEAIVTYLWKMAAPFHLLPFYPYSKNISLFSLTYAGAVLLVCGITAASVLTARRNRVLAAAWGYYLLSLLPVLGIIRIGHHAMADRYTYLSSLGPFLLAGLLAAWLWTGASGLLKWRFAARAFLLASAFGLCAVMSLLTVRQVGVWNNGIDFWSYVIKNAPVPVPVAYNNRGAALKEKGRLDPAIADLTVAINLYSEKGRGTFSGMTGAYLAYNNRGSAFQAKGQFGRAMEDYDAAIRLEPSAPLAYYNRGILLGSMGQPYRAIQDFTAAISRDPEYADAITNRGWVYRRQGNFDLALEDYTAAVRLRPFSPVAYYNRAMVWGERGRLELAIADYTEAISLDPAYADAYINRGLLFGETGLVDRALADLGRAIELNPRRVEAYNNRGLAFEMSGRLDEAVSDYSTAIALAPDDYTAYVNRGIAYGKMRRDDKAIEDYSRAISLKPDLARAYLDRADLYLRTGAGRLALDDFRKACGLGSGDACAALRARVRR